MSNKGNLLIHIYVVYFLEIKCLDGNGKLTALGNILAELPVEPQFGRMLILSNILMLGEPLSIIAASSTDSDLFNEDFGIYIMSDNKSYLRKTITLF